MPRTSTMAQSVSINDLRVGMYVHLDLGWMQHPFARSSFRIQSPQQIAALRGLGLQHIRWDPQASDPVAAPAPPAASAASGPAVLPSEEELQARQRRARLAQYRQQLAETEQECSEANRALRDISRRALADPQAAGVDAQALSRKLLDRLAGAGEVCIRLVNTRAGERAGAHALNVVVIALLMGRALGLPDAEMQALSAGAMLHDIGKLELPDRLRHHEPAFNVAETRAYREHVAHGLAIGQRMGLSAAVLAVIAQHHECADGSGFPQQLRGDQIVPAARITAIADRYDKLCNPATMAATQTPHEAVSLLFTQQQRQFDAALLAGFIRMMGVYPAGSLVQLSDDRSALVMAVNSSRPLKPQVLVHDPQVAADEALLLDLERTPGLAIRRSLPAAQLAPAARAYLAPRQHLSYFFEPVRPDDQAAV